MKETSIEHHEALRIAKDWLSNDPANEKNFAQRKENRSIGETFLSSVLGYEPEAFVPSTSTQLPDFLPANPRKTPWVLYVHSSENSDLMVTFHRRALSFPPDERAKGIDSAVIIGKTGILVCNYTTFLPEFEISFDRLRGEPAETDQVISWTKFLTKFSKPRTLTLTPTEKLNTPLSQVIFLLSSNGWGNTDTFRDRRISTCCESWNEAHSKQKWTVKDVATLSRNEGAEPTYLFTGELKSSKDTALSQSAKTIRTFSAKISSLTSRSLFSSLYFITERQPSHVRYWLFYVPSTGEILNPLPPMESDTFEQTTSLPDRWKDTLKSKPIDIHLFFRREVLGDRFFDDYANTWKGLAGELPRGVTDKFSYAQLVLSRLLFLRFMEHYGHLNRAGFLRLMASMIRDDRTKPAVAKDLLNALWFESLAKPKSKRNFKSVPTPVAESLADVAYWNGGLFRVEKGLDDVFISELSKSRDLAGHLLNVLDWVERWEIWGGERGSVEIVPEIAGLDRSLLGSVFERVLQLSGSEQRHDRGQYYTSPQYIQYIVEEALAEYLRFNKPIGSFDYEALIRNFRDPEKDFLSAKEATTLLENVRNLTWLDPAVGTNGFGEGALSLHVAFSTYLADTAKIDFQKWRFAKKVASEQICGVDIEARGIELSKLRIFLALATAVPHSAVKEVDTPILPNLDDAYQVGNALTTGSSIQPFLIKGKPSPSGQREAAGSFSWHNNFPNICKAQGWDIIVANFPYVRQERMAAVQQGKEDELFQQVVGEENRGRADYCTYFMAIAPRLLKPGGVSCYLSTISWAEADYGEPVQRHLAGAGGLVRLTENRIEQVFENAKVTPLIVTSVNFPKPEDAYQNVEARGLLYPIRTPDVALKGKPKQIEVSVKRSDLLDAENAPWGPYKWAGPLLRSEDWFSKIISKGLRDGRLVRLSNYRDTIRRGLTTNCNPFFYCELVENKSSKLSVIRATLPTRALKNVEKHSPRWASQIKGFEEGQTGISKTFTIESEYVVPLLLSPKELKTTTFKHGGRRVFINLPEDVPRDSYAREYLDQWGKGLAFNKWVVSLKNKDEWWHLTGAGARPSPAGTLLWLKGHSADRLKLSRLNEEMVVDCNLFLIEAGVFGLRHLMSSSIWLQRLIVGKTSLADGLIKTEIPDFEWLAIPTPERGTQKDVKNRKLINLIDSEAAAKTFFEEGDEMFREALGLKTSVMNDILDLALTLNKAHLRRAGSTFNEESDDDTGE